MDDDLIRGLVPDDLWNRVRGHLPVRLPQPRGGRPWRDDRACLAGIVFVLRHGVGWRSLPAGFGVNGMTCWRRLRDWQQAGVWKVVHQGLLGDLHKAGLCSPEVAVADSGTIRAVGVGQRGIRPRDATPLIAAGPAPSTTC
jgi:transposase